MPTLCNNQDHDKSNCHQFDYMIEGFYKINAQSLVKSFSYWVWFVLNNKSVWGSFNLKDLLILDNILYGVGWYKSLCNNIK